MGHIHETSCVPKFTRQTAHRHIHAHRAAHYARRQPRAARRAPAQGRIRVKDLRALCMRSPRHVLKGVYEVNHRQVHVHTYTQGHMGHEPATKTEGLAELAVKEKKRTRLCWIIV